ncbi:hypothetical protein YC2023_004787 [Brassica napus]
MKLAVNNHRRRIQTRINYILRDSIHKSLYKDVKNAKIQKIQESPAPGKRFRPTDEFIFVQVNTNSQNFGSENSAEEPLEELTPHIPAQTIQNSAHLNSTHKNLQTINL